jgi:hypothetical protein
MIAPVRLVELYSGALDDRHQFTPRLKECLCAFFLKLSRQGVDIDSGVGKARQQIFAVASIGRQN